MSWAVALGAGFCVLFPWLLLPVGLLSLPRLTRHLPKYYGWSFFGCLLWALPELFQGSGLSLGQPLGQIAVVCFLTYSFYHLARRVPSPSAVNQAVLLGVGVGAALLAGISYLQISGVFRPLTLPELLSTFARNSDPLLYPGRASGWLDHPNLWALTAFVPALLGLVLPRPPRWAWGICVPGLAVIVLAGSRGALLGFFAALVLLGASLAVSRRTKVIAGGLAAGLGIALTLYLPSLSGFGALSLTRFGWLEPPGENVNLLASSEDLDDRVSWKTQSVQVNLESGTTPAVWQVDKLGEAANARLYQSLSLAPEQTYTLSAELKSSDADAVMGLAGWGRAEGQAYSVAYVAYKKGVWVPVAQEKASISNFSSTPLANGWHRLELSFSVAGSEPLTWHLGPTPDQRPLASGARLYVRALQLEEAGRASAYQPSFAKDRVRRDARRSVDERARIYSAVWQAFLRKPLLGWGTGQLTDYLRRAVPASSALHAHNLFLQTLFERGLVGTLGLSLLLFGLARSGAVGSGKYPVLVMAVVIINLFDYTFWSTQVIYPLAASCGWLAGLGEA